MAGAGDFLFKNEPKPSGTVSREELLLLLHSLPPWGWRERLQAAVDFLGGSQLWGGLQAVPLGASGELSGSCFLQDHLQLRVTSRFCVLRRLHGSLLPISLALEGDCSCQAVKFMSLEVLQVPPVFVTDLPPRLFFQRNIESGRWNNLVY